MTRRSLILAGGGLKIAYQAGVLQVWLDEAGVEFDHADAVSAATFNLAMWCQGMSGRQIADNWRRFRPLRAVAPNWRGLLRLPVAESLLTFRRIRRNVFPAFGLDWTAVRATSRLASFNVFNVSRQRVEVFPPSRMSEDVLVAAGSLPIFFPPVTLDGEVYVDAVHAGAANLEHAVEQGADELWIIWTTSTAGRWRNGPVAEYFAVFEPAANARLQADLRRIEDSNARPARNEPGGYGRHITVHLLQQEVPLHYLFTVSRRRFAAAVEMGVADARAWCRAQGLLVQKSWFVAAAGVVGDLDNPFYAEERQRDVWNEACAVGLQLGLALAAATGMVWIGGAPALPYAVTLVSVEGVVAVVTLAYAQRLGVRFDDAGGMLRLRLVPYGALLVAFFVGVFRVAPADGFASGFVRGMVGGSAAAVLWLLCSGIRARRRQALRTD
jgi:predicted acylesterase/phospholipase RssA